jgi:hypothetical protein
MMIQIDTLPDNADAVIALAWMRHITKAIGPGFHPDTPISEYINCDTLIPLFSESNAARIASDLDRVFELLEAAGRDPYAVAGRVQRRLLGLPTPE